MDSSAGPPEADPPSPRSPREDPILARQRAELRAAKDAAAARAKLTRARNQSRRAAAVTEIRRLHLQAACIADAFFTLSVSSKVDELREEVTAGEARLAQIDADDAETLARTDISPEDKTRLNAQRKAERSMLTGTVKLARLQVISLEFEHAEVSELAESCTELFSVDIQQFPPELSGGTLSKEQRKVTSRAKKAATERSEGLQLTIYKSAQQCLDERWQLAQQRIRRADEFSEEEFEQGKIVGEKAAKVMVDTKRKSKLLQQSDDLAAQAQALLKQTVAFQDLEASLEPNQTLNAQEFLVRSQGVMDEVMRIQREASSPKSLAIAEAKLMESLWAKLDVDNSETLDVVELRGMMRELEIELADDQYTDAMAEIDTDASGDVDKSEFMAWWAKQPFAKQQQLTSHINEMEAVWDSVDTDQSGTLDAEEVKALLIKMDQPVGDAEFAALMQTIDKDGSGTVDKHEFLVWWGMQVTPDTFVQTNSNLPHSARCAFSSFARVQCT
jgi:hypothetical protein